MVQWTKLEGAQDGGVMLGIISFVIGWVGLLHQEKQGTLTSPLQYWSLIDKIKQLPSTCQIEDYAPQVCNLILITKRPAASFNLERILLDRCATNMILGIKSFCSAKVGHEASCTSNTSYETCRHTTHQ